MNSLFKNFLYIFKRFRTASLLNVIGLTAAFVGFILLLIQISYEVNFDKYYPDYKDIYRARYELSGEEDGQQMSFLTTLFIRNMADKIIDISPQVEQATLLYPYHENLYFQVDREGTKQGFKESLVTCYPDMPVMFGFQMVEGDRECLKDPQYAIIPESLAKRLFGGSSAMGKTLYFDTEIATKTAWKGGNVSLVVGGVYKDFPQNVQLENIIYSAMHPEAYKDKDDLSSTFFFYVTLAKGTDPKQLEDLLEKHQELFGMDSRIQAKLLLDNVSDVYFSDDGGSPYGNRGYKTGDKNTSLLLAIIAVLVIVVAAINFANFSVALAPRRIRSLNIRKVLGSSNATLRVGIVNEAIAISLFSFILAVGLVYLIISSHWMPFIDTGISTKDLVNILLIALGVALLTGCVAGVRPAFYMTSFAPSEALKGKAVYTTSGFKWRDVLVGFQFVIAIALISATVLMFAQFKFIQNYRLGFDTDQVAIIELSEEISLNRKNEYIDNLKRFPGIVDVAFSHQKLGASDGYVQYSGMRLNESEETHNYMLFPVSWNFLSVMNIQVLEGRSFTERDATSGETSLIIGKTTQKNTGANIGDSFAYQWRPNVPQRVVGIVDDIQFSSLRRQMGNIAFTLNDKNGHNKLPISYIKIAAGASVGDVVKHINQAIAAIDPAFPVKIEFYDEIFNQLYQRENKLSNSIYAFSLLTIIIAIMGVFGLVVFECEARKKEIAVRKVMGSTIAQVLLLFNTQYVRILSVSFIIAIPGVYYLINQWLQSFAYKTPIYWWMLAFGGLIVLLITVLTVSAQSYRTARSNPVLSLQEE